MIPSESVKSTAEWQALNRIWKSSSPEQRAALQDEFQIITAFIREHTNTNKPKQLLTPKSNQDNYKYLNRLSDQAKTFVITVVESGEKNIYHSIMASMDAHPQLSSEEFKEYYFKRNREKRPYLLENRKLVEEVIDLCWDKRHSD